MFAPYFQASIIGKAQDAKLIEIHAHDLRDYATNKHRSADERPYGGGAGMVLRPEVVVDAVRDLKSRHGIEKVIYLSPQGSVFSHAKAKEYAGLNSILLLCGRYEGLDERAIELVVDEELSIGDYVLTGGELAAQVVVDAVSRLIPGVVGDEAGPVNDSHAAGLLEYPHYTRPPVLEGLEVPAVLMSGDHAAIEEWRRRQSLKNTLKKRPDLLEKAPLSEADKKYLKSL